MSGIAAYAGMADTWTISIMIFGVLGFCALIGLLAWRFIKSAEKTLVDPRRLRRRLIVSGAIYALCAINVLVSVATGGMPPLALVGLPIGLAYIWFFLRTASRIKIPPK